MLLDKQHPKPVYQQLKNILQDRIVQGQYLAHQKLPSERCLGEQYGLSRMTVRKSLKQLATEGWLYTRAGKGTFVSGQIADLITGYNAKTLQTKQGYRLPANSAAHQQLIKPLVAYNCVAVEQTISQFLALYPLEIVAGQLFPEIICQLEQAWHTGQVNLQAHNYAITTLVSQVVSMVNAAPLLADGPKVLLGCAPEDQHEFGLLLLALHLRRRGFQVIYLGATLALSDFYKVVQTAAPQVICLSAATEPAVQNINEVSASCMQRGIGRFSLSDGIAGQPLITFGGVAFSQNLSLVSSVDGVFLGATIGQAVTKIETLSSKMGWELSN